MLTNLKTRIRTIKALQVGQTSVRAAAEFKDATYREWEAAIYAKRSPEIIAHYQAIRARAELEWLRAIDHARADVRTANRETIAS